MTQLARTPPAERRLFQVVDLAPLPKHRVIVEALDAWRQRRGPNLAPDAADLDRDQSWPVSDHSLVAEPSTALDDFALRKVGASAAVALGSGARADSLTELADKRVAVRLRHLLRLALERGESVDVQFTDRGRAFEMLAAPVRADGRAMGLFCAVVAEDRPRTIAGAP
jgi:hypothetical protein